jgi:hypothetical protein
VFEYVDPVIVQVRVLLSRELPNADTGVDAPRVKELISHFRHDDQPLVIGEGDIPFVEQVIDMWR